MAYGYDLIGDDLTLFIYDPNFHHNDNITLKLNIGNPRRPLEITYSEQGPVYCFFRTNYAFSMPPESGGIMPGRIILFEDENFCGKSIDIVREHYNLSAHKAGNFKNFTSSFVILSGKWTFYRQPNFESPIVQHGKPLIFAPGTYPRVTDCGIQDNEITSLRRYVSRFLLSYGYVMGSVTGAGDVAAHQARLSIFLGDRGSVTLGGSTGREAESMGSAGVLVMDVESAGVWGVLPLESRLDLTWAASTTTQGDLYTRTHLALGARVLLRYSVRERQQDLAGGPEVWPVLQ